MRNSRRVRSSLRRTAEFAPSNKRLSTSPRCGGCPAGARLRCARGSRSPGARSPPRHRPPARRPRRPPEPPSRPRVVSSDCRSCDVRRPPDDAIVGPDEPRDERGPWAIVEILRRAELFESPVVHHSHVIGQHEGLGLIMRDVDERRAECGLQLLELDLHVLAKLQIERAQRLIEEQKGRLQHQASRDGDPLPLAAGELVDSLVRRAAESHALEHLPAALRRARLAQSPRRARPKATFSPTDIIGNRASCWNTMFTGRRLGATPRMLLPPMEISPRSGAMNPAIMRSSVVLPQPDGPRIEKKLPRSTLKDRESTATVIGEALDDAVGDQIRGDAQFGGLDPVEHAPVDLLQPGRYRGVPVDALEMRCRETMPRTAP